MYCSESIGSMALQDSLPGSYMVFKGKGRNNWIGGFDPVSYLSRESG